MNHVQNTTEIRSWNKKKIIEFLRQTQSVTKKELADALHLSIATVSTLCNQLLADGIIHSQSSRTSNGGRIPEIMSIEPCSRYCIGLNVIGTLKAEIAITDLLGNPVISKQFSVSKSLAFEQMVALYHQVSVSLIVASGVQPGSILGVGVAAPGIYSESVGKLVNSTNPALENQALKSVIEKQFELPTFIENESNLMVLATSLKSPNANTRHDILYLYMGEGLGMGVLCNDRLVTGSHGLGGEISHMPIGNRNFPCYCGKSGCVETELSRGGFLRKYHDQCGVPPSPTNEEEDWQAFIQAVMQQEACALKVMEENGRLFGRLVSVLVNLFDPQTVYVGGITSPIFDFLSPWLMEEAAARQTVKGKYPLQIVNSPDDEKLIFKGCSELVLAGWKP